MKVRWPSWAPVLNKPTVSVDVKQHSTNIESQTVQSPEDEEDVLGSLSLIVLTVSVDVKQR